MFAKLTNDTWSGTLHLQCNVQLALSLTSVVIDHVIIDLLYTDTARLLCRLRWPSTTLHGVPRAWRHTTVTDPTHDVTYNLTPQCNKHTLQPSTLLEQLYCTTILREGFISGLYLAFWFISGSYRHFPTTQQPNLVKDFVLSRIQLRYMTLIHFYFQWIKKQNQTIILCVILTTKL